MLRVMPWSVLLWLVATAVSLVSPVAAFYGVAVPYAIPGGPVPNVDCIFVYKCAQLPAATNVNATSSLPSQLPADIDYDHALPVYVGRAAGRCQRRIQAHKCAIQDVVVLQNQCRAATWPDEDTLSTPADLTSVEACIVEQCQGKQIVVQYHVPQVSSSAQLRQLQQYWMTHSTRDSSPVTKAICNQDVDTLSAMPSVPPVWVEVPSIVWSGPFGTEGQMEPPSRTCLQSACLLRQTLPHGLLPGTCNKTIPMGFHCTLEILPGFVVESGSLQLVCQDQLFSTIPTVEPQFPLVDDVSTLFNASVLISDALPPGRRLLMNGAGDSSASSSASGASASSSSSSSQLISVHQYFQHILGSSYQLRGVLPLNNVGNVSNALEQARLEIQLRFYGDHRPLFNPLRYFLWRVILTDGTMIVVALANHEENKPSAHSMSSITRAQERKQPTMPLDRTPRSWGYLVAIFQVDQARVPPNGEWAPPEAHTLVYPVQQNNIQLAQLNAPAVEYDGTQRNQFQFAADNIGALTIQTLPGQQALLGAAARENVKQVIRRLAVMLAEPLRSHFVEAFLVGALTRQDEVYVRVDWANTPVAWHPRGFVTHGDGAPPGYDTVRTDLDNGEYVRFDLLWLYQNYWRFAAIRGRAMIAGEDIVGLDNALLPPMEHRQFERHLVQRGRIAVPPADLRALVEEAVRFEQQARVAYRTFLRQAEVGVLRDGIIVGHPEVHRITLNTGLLQSAYYRVRPDNRLDGEADAFDIAAVRLHIWQRAVDARVELQALLANLPPEPLNPANQLPAACDHARACGCFHGPHFGPPGPPALRRLLSLGANSTSCVPLYDAPALLLPIHLGSDVWEPLLGDANGDGLADLVAYDGVICKSAATFLFSGRDFALQRCLPFNLSADVVHGDFDGDHNWDYLVRSAPNDDILSPCAPAQYPIFYTRNDGAVGRIECINTVRANSTAFDILVLDLDGDLTSDLLAHATVPVTTPSATTTSLFNQHTSSFYASATSLDDTLHLPVAPAKILIGNLNGDGADDLFVVCSNAPCGGCPTRAMAVASLGNGSFSAPSCLPAFNFSGVPDVWVADVDGDGLADVITSAAIGDCARMSVFITRLDPNTTVPRWASPTCSGPDISHAHFKLLLGDVDGDGDVDLVFAHDMTCPTDGFVTSSYWLSDLDAGPFALQRCLSASFVDETSPAFLGLLDINGDGAMEVITHPHGAVTTSVLFLSDATSV